MGKLKKWKVILMWVRILYWAGYVTFSVYLLLISLCLLSVRQDMFQFDLLTVFLWNLFWHWLQSNLQFPILRLHPKTMWMSFEKEVRIINDKIIKCFSLLIIDPYWSDTYFWRLQFFVSMGTLSYYLIWQGIWYLRRNFNSIEEKF